ncbi:MAG TPA: rod shape-determining protein MreC [Pyrinomonadaceae bacterium]|jgi:rod shape-determining protein MreC|nr:rod shape-determining protein MreC [Pyrinomonadaceae bacterium]
MVERSQKEVWRLTPWLMIALLLGNFLLMAYDAKTTSQERVIRVWTQAVANFVQSPVTTVTSSVTNYFQSISSLRSAQTENDALKQRVQELEVEVQQKKELAKENESLKSLLELKNEAKYKILPAQIIGRDPSLWFDSAIINRGSLDGVKLNMPIVNNGGLIGRVIAVSPITAQINLVTKEKSGLGGVIGELGTSNALGVVSGNGKRELLEMGYIPGTIEVQVGEMVYTTGQDGIYPAGLKIGEVAEVRPGSATVTQQIFIKPSAKLYAMEEVAVLLYEPAAKPEFEKTLPNASKDEKKKK